MKNATLRARIERLEQAVAVKRQGEERICFTVGFIEPRAIPGELRGLYLGSGEGRCYVAREPNETEEALRARVMAMNAGSVTVLYEDREYVPTGEPLPGSVTARPSGIHIH